ncbi:HAD-IB family hydrolase, partial [Streptomyces anulatus]
AAEHGYDLTKSYAYSDSVTDLPMLEVVGHPTVVNPDRGLRRIAVEKDWPVQQFVDPVSLRSRIPTPSGRAVAVTAIGIGAVAAAGAAWYGLRRKRSRD